MEYEKRGLPGKIFDALNLRKGEERTVFLLVIFSFFQFFSVAIFFITASAIFLTKNSITKLPYVYIGTCIALLSFGAIFQFLERRFSAKRLILAETLLVLAGVLMFRLGFLSEEITWLGFLLIIWHRVMADFVSDGFNRLALLLFDVRQSKRLFGLISSSEIPASILGYSAASVLVPLIGTPNLLWISAAGLAISFFFLVGIVSGKEKLLAEETAEEQKPEVTKKAPGVFETLFHSRFIYFLSLTLFFSVITFTVIEFAFLSRVDAEFTDQQEIVLFISVILGMGQIIAFFVKTFLYGFIQRKYGIKVSLFVLPVVLVVISIATLLEGLVSESRFMLIWTWVIIMVVTETLRSSLYNTTFLSLLQPLTKKVKLLGFAILGNVESIAIGLTGLVLLLAVSLESLSLVHYSGMLLMAAAGWIMVIPRLNKAYLMTLEEVLKKRIVEGGVLELKNPQTLKIVHEKLHSEHPGEVLYALDVLCKEKNLITAEIFSRLLKHRLPEVRKEVYMRAESLKISSLQEIIRNRIEEEPVSELKKLAIHAYCSMGETSVVDEITPLLDSEDKEVQLGALVGLICFGGINGIIVAGQRLMEYVNSQDPTLRKFAAEAIGEIGIRNFYHPLLVLLRDDRIEVEKEALRAAGKIKHPRLFQPLLNAVSSPNVFEVAVNALVKSGEGVIDLIEPELDKRENSSAHLRRLIYVCGRVGGDRSVNILKSRLYFPDIEVRNQVVQSCANVAFRPTPEDKQLLLKTIHQELTDANWFLNCFDVFLLTNQLLSQSNLQLLIRALRIELNYIKKRLLFLLAFLYDSREILQLWNNLQIRNREKAANALEIIDVLVSKELSAVVLPVLEDFPINQQVKILQAKFPVRKLTADEYLFRLISGSDCPVILPWTRAVAAYLVNQVRIATVSDAVSIAARDKNLLVSETAEWTIRNLAAESPEVLPMVHHDNNQYVLPIIEKPAMNAKLLTIEKVMALKTTGLFRETAEDLLVDIAFILKEVAFTRGELIVEKNEVGTCMFIIYSGSVKVHDGDHMLAELHSRDFFGELSLLDAEPRSASVTAMEDSLLLRIDQHAFYEIMADRMEVIREIMKILCSRLRHQNQEVARLSEQLSVSEKGVAD